MDNQTPRILTSLVNEGLNLTENSELEQMHAALVDCLFVQEMIEAETFPVTFETFQEVFNEHAGLNPKCVPDFVLNDPNSDNPEYSFQYLLFKMISDRRK